MEPPLRQPPAPRGIGWGLVAGIVGSLCCLGPAAAALLGLGASSALAALQIGRAPAIGLALLLLSAGVALAARRGASCGLSRAARLRAPLVMIAVFGLSYALLAQALPAAAARQIAAAAALAPPSPPPAPAAQRRLTLSIEKMYCPPCAARVSQLLAERAGVVSFTAIEALDEVTVDYRPSEVSADALARIVPSTYGVVVLSDVALP
jgi:copper chaperone CopZ